MYFDTNEYEFIDPKNLDYYNSFNKKFLEEQQKVPERVHKNRLFHLITDLSYDMILKDLSQAQDKHILGVSAYFHTNNLFRDFTSLKSFHFL